MSSPRSLWKMDLETFYEWPASFFGNRERKSNNGLLLIKDLRKSHAYLSGKSYLILVYPFPIVTITNYCKPSSLKQHKLTILQLWNSQVPNQSHWTKMKVLAGLVPFGSSRGESVALPFPAPAWLWVTSVSVAHVLPHWPCCVSFLRALGITLGPQR